MFCPECEAEYRPSFSLCADCGVGLVDDLPLEIKEGSEPVVVFATADTIAAAMVKSLLEGSAVKAALVDEHFSRMESPLSFAIGGVKVVVPQHQEAQAHEVLNEYRGASGEDPGRGHNSCFNVSGTEARTREDG